MESWLGAVFIYFVIPPVLCSRMAYEVGFARFFLCHFGVIATKAVFTEIVVDCLRKLEIVVGVELMSQLIIDKIQDYLQGLLPSMGLELFDIQFRRETNGWVLRLFIDSLDKNTGVSLQNCSDVSRELGQYLDVDDTIDHAYNLEVSSPGLERPLRSLEDFQIYYGKDAKVKLHDALDGQKIFEGIIDTVVNEIICMKLVDGRSIKFSYEMINKARLTI